MKPIPWNPGKNALPKAQRGISLFGGDMGLSMKFNLVLIPISALGIWASSYST